MQECHTLVKVDLGVRLPAPRSVERVRLPNSVLVTTDVGDGAYGTVGLGPHSPKALTILGGANTARSVSNRT
jgi:hypothetical protein